MRVDNCHRATPFLRGPLNPRLGEYPHIGLVWFLKGSSRHAAGDRRVLVAVRHNLEKHETPLCFHVFTVGSIWRVIVYERGPQQFSSLRTKRIVRASDFTSKVKYMFVSFGCQTQDSGVRQEKSLVLFVAGNRK